MTPPLHDEIRARLSKAQRALLIKLGAGMQPISRRETTSALCLVKVAIAPCIFAELVEHRFGMHHSPNMARLTSLGEQVRAHILQENDHG